MEMRNASVLLGLSTATLLACGVASSAYGGFASTNEPTTQSARSAATAKSGKRSAAKGVALKPKRFAGHPRSRAFRFHYGATLKGLRSCASVRVWMPVPKDGDYQTVRESARCLPADATISAEPKYGNKILYFETRASGAVPLDFGVSYRVTRDEIRGLTGPATTTLAATDLPKFLGANSMVPLGGKPIELLRSMRLPRDDVIALARVLYDRVDQHMQYDKSRPGYGNGDALWACNSGYGNCTDFHSLFISMSRSKGLPARFEIGFPLPREKGAGTIGGYHCWAFFFVKGRGWAPVDISEADKNPESKDYHFGNLTEDRVAFAVGRDIDLVPKQSGAPLNFFVYPHIEVDGKPLPRDQVDYSFRYEDLSATRSPVR